LVATNDHVVGLLADPHSHQGLLSMRSTELAPGWPAFGM
jgi:hypothetical protein